MVEPAPALHVRLHGIEVGYISSIGGGTVFSFTREFLEAPQPPTLSLGFLDRFGRPRASTQFEPGLTAFFENLLPEGRLREYIAMKAGIAPRESVRLLRFVGQDLPGAVTVEDAVAVSEPAPSVAPSLDGPLRFSLAGVQLKFSAVRNARGGLTIRADGAGGHWIVKLPSLEFANVPENEAATLDFARRCGIVVPEHELVEVSSIEGLPSEIARRAERYALAVQRFDRFPTGEKIHMEDFNQVFRQQPREKYDNHDFASIARVLAVVVGSEALRDFIRRLTFTVAVGNGDMHLKNWSLVYPDGHLPELSPAYDLVPTRGYLPSDDLGLQLGRTKRFEELGAIDLASFAKKADIASKLVVATVNETIEQIREQWKTYRERAPQTLAATVDEQFKRVPLLSSTRS